MIFGSESVIIGLLRQIGLSDDVYSSKLQCYNCCDIFTITPQLVSRGVAMGGPGPKIFYNNIEYYKDMPFVIQIMPPPPLKF